MKKYKYTCSWCGKEFGETSVPNNHGMCPECYKKEMAKLDKEEKKK